MFDFLTSWISDSPLTYLVILGLTAADIIAIIPAETVIVTAVVLALQANLLVVGVAAAAVIGAVIGDNILYFLGRRFGPRLADRLFRGDTSRERLDWAQRQMHRHRTLVIIAGRFVPVGRTATMFAAGLLNVPWRQFIWPEVIAVLLWAAYYVCVPVLFGGTLPSFVTIGVSIGIAIVLGGIAELVRRFLERRQDPSPESSR